MGAKIGLAVLFFILCSFQGLAATIHGNVYSLSLEKERGATLEVNTTPMQVLIATDGTYSFEIPRGVYLISAKEKEGLQVIAMENRTVAVAQEGTYVIDFILFPLLDDEEFIDLDFSDVAGSEVNWVFVVVFLIAAIGIGGGVAFFSVWRKKNNTSKNAHETTSNSQEETITPVAIEKNDDDYLSQTLAIIKKHGGRATQKDIRKEIPLSEAKISLLITELEHKGKIEKIKKGRGNIIILK